MTEKHPLIRHRAKWLSFTLGLIVVGCVLYFYRGSLNQESIVAFSERLPAFWVIAGFLVLPLCGVPIRIMLILAGFRFGFGWGMVLSGLGIFFHNYAAYFIARGSFRAAVRDFLKRSGYVIPPVRARHRIWLTAAVAAIPGPPYFAKLYLMALTDLPLRIFVGVGASIYFLLSVVPVGIGAAVVDYEAKWAYLLAFAFVVITVLGLWLRKRYAGFVEVENADEAEQA
ncbi:MAG: TVP38/TMEM64 family protein [Opitutales bacterium]